MANEVAKKDTFSTQLTTQLVEVKDALPNGFNKARFVQNCVALLNDNEPLQKFVASHGTAQVIQGLMLGAYQGLDFFNKECYLIPQGNKLDFRKDYKGLIKLIKKYSIKPVADVYAKIIRDGDILEEVIINGQQSINFRPKFLNDGEILGAFAVCLYADGSLKYEVMTKAEIEDCRKVSKVPNGNAWKNFYGEMCKKTVIHRLDKGIEKEFENIKQQELYIDEEMKIETDTQAIVDMEIEQNANAEEFIDMEESAEQE